MEILNNHPEIIKQLETLYKTRSGEILSQMLNNDNDYQRLCNEREEASTALKKAVNETEADALFEKYSDTIYAQEIHEHDCIYRQATHDTVNLLSERGLLSL